MPNQLTSAEETDLLAILLDVEYNGYLWRDVAAEYGVADCSAIAFVKLAAETDQIRVWKGLIAKHHDAILCPNKLQCVDAYDLGCEGITTRYRVDRHGGPLRLLGSNTSAMPTKSARPRDLNHSRFGAISPRPY